jgi:hypothetical protein
VPMSWPTEYARHLDVRTTSIYPLPKMSPDRALDGLARSDVAITWVKLLGTGTSSYALRIQQRGTNDILLVRNYFNNTSGPPSKGPGAIESIKFKDKTVGFPASQG